MSQLRQSYPKFRELNTEVLVIAAAGLKPVAKFAQDFALPFPVLSDGTEAVYRAFGLGKGLAIGPRTIVEFVRLAWQEGGLHWPAGDIMQIGGDFIVDGEGIIRYAHRSEDPTDRPDASELLRLMAELK